MPFVGAERAGRGGLASCSVVLGLLGLAGLVACGPRAPFSKGLEVIEISAQGAAARAGLQLGDRLLSYIPPGSPGESRPFASCLDFRWVGDELGPRSSVALGVERRGQMLELEIGAGDWGFRVAPGESGTPSAQLCGWLDSAYSAWSEGSLEEAGELYRRALAFARPLDDPRPTAHLLHLKGLLDLQQGKLAAAEEGFSEALSLRRAVAAESLAVAASWHALGLLAQQRSRWADSDAAFETECALRRDLAPGHLDLVWCLANLGINSFQRQDFTAARRHYSQALELAARIEPGGAAEASMRSNLGLLARAENRLDEAWEQLRQARELFDRLDPASQPASRNLVNLALVSLARGDLSAAEQLHQQALVLFEKTSPESLAVAQIYENLGVIARQRANFDQAEALLRRALTLRERLGAGPRARALSSSLLAWVLLRRGRIEEAQSLAEAGLAWVAQVDTAERVAGEIPEATGSLQVLAEVAVARGEWDRALLLLERVVRWRRQRQPGSMELANSLSIEVDLLDHMGRFEQAEAVCREALALLESLAPDSFLMASLHGHLARLLTRRGRLAEAAEASRLGVVALEAQMSRLGGDDAAHGDFQREHAELYERWIGLELDLGRPREAFAVLERSRGRRLLAELRSRDLGGPRELSPEVRAERGALDGAYDRAQFQLGRLGATAGEAERQALQAELASLRSRRATNRDRIALGAPRYAALAFPSPLELDTLRAELDAGTLWLSYSVAPHELVLFVVPSLADQPDPERALRVVRIPIERGRLERDVALFRGLILAGHDEPAETQGLATLGRELYRLLVAPAEPELASARRVLLSPDGPLQVLPFSALVVPGERMRYWSEGQPLSLVLSGTLLAELRQSRGGEVAESRGLALVAPETPREKGAEAALGSVVGRYRAGLGALPGARAEAAALRRLFGSEVEILAGRQAREERVKGLAGRVPFLHFAGHALVDSSSPLDSGLALSSPPGGGDGGLGDNGVLQAWEIFSQVRVSTPLVVLSACETGLGADGAGEGLIGLTRAFQYAGARSVLASLWQVGDRSTAALMESFYAAWLAGRPRDEALAEAQRALIASGGASAHPYHWAAFELHGDPR